ncbi:MAG: formylglycine-generating enzyme family protein [Desulfamplus sp.]|nr:formylglycine-generating enzyme family protein [Desulfamplus sp.]
MHIKLTGFKVKIIFLVISILLAPPNADNIFGAEKIFTNRLGMTFVLIPAGKFVMGSPENEPGREWNEKLHTVVISKSFYMQETEVTQGQWKRLVQGNPSAFQDCGDHCPVDTVSWYDSMEFISFLNKYEGTDKYRLPTEAEWEYACRAGSTTAFYGGPLTRDGCIEPDPVLDPIAWYCANSGYKTPPDGFRPHPAKTKLPNAWGLYDMHGNVQEWVLDSCKWREVWSFKGRTGVITSTYKDNIVDPLSETGDHKIFRGGAWHQPPRLLRSAKRGYYKPVAKRNSLGFRIVREQ